MNLWGFFYLERVLQVERLGLDTIKVGFVYNIVLCRKSVIGADRSWDRANGQDLRFYFKHILDHFLESITAFYYVFLSGR